MSNGSEEAVGFKLTVQSIASGDLLVAKLTETLFSYLIGYRGGTEEKSSWGEHVRLLGVWSTSMEEQAVFVDKWLTKHDHPKQHAWSKTLTAYCATSDLRDREGRVLALVRCGQCSSGLNNDLATQGLLFDGVREARELLAADYAQHLRALTVLKTTLSRTRFGADALMHILSGQQPMALEV